ncbi:Cell wall-associated hydrolase, NlpC family [Aquimarina amphilecti]|uniref:Cell wall-associated hydrolase, NlpC family n=1 Tax=Aquimarina amphilecti TaxID=1038014 RepID=A0A1H7NJB4_AQUAM|nr:C40 family peptidase [Aquimarina amphilecti]SEL23474.1 Cell wall-associated hydrolase, NlpC family [Aquimarina amphilecti]
MNKLFYFLLILSITLASCGGAKKRSTVSRKTAKTSKTKRATPKNKKITSIINYAKTFEGTRYKYGGTTKKGMDCSGLVYTSFKKEEVVLPRTSKAMSVQGKKISLKNVTVGDLLFFRTNKNKNAINHVGLVVKTGNRVEFIHASTSKGVTISSLDERYWNNCFAGVRRIL